MDALGRVKRLPLNGCPDLVIKSLTLGTLRQIGSLRPRSRRSG